MQLDKRRSQAGGLQCDCIHLRHLLAKLHFFFQNGQFGQQNSGLQCVQAAVYADADMVVAAVLAVARNLADNRGQLLIVGENRTAIAIAAQGFAWEKAGAGNGAQVARFCAFINGTKALRGIFDHRQLVLGCDGVDGIEISTLAIQ